MFFDAIFSNHSNFKSLLLQSQYALSDYYVILNMIKQDKDRYDLFLLCLTQDEKNKIFSETSLNNIVAFFHVLKINKLDKIFVEWKEYFRQVAITELVQKAKQLSLRQLSGSLIYIRKVLDIGKAKTILNQIDTDWLVERARQANLRNVSIALIELRTFDTNKAWMVLQQLELAWLVEKARQTNFTDIGHALVELRIIDMDNTRAILQQLDSAWLVEQAKQANFTDIGHSLVEFRKIDADKAIAILHQLDLAWLVEQARQANFTDIGHALVELMTGMRQSTSNIEFIKPIWISQQMLGENFSKIGEALSNFKSVDMDIAHEISNYLSADDLASKIHETSYGTFLWHIPVIAKINPDLTCRFLEEIDETYLFQMRYMENIVNFNKLLFACHFSNFKEGTQRLITFAHERLNYFLEAELKNVKSFLELISNYEDISLIIENNVPRLVYKILSEKDTHNISKFIGFTHKYSPKSASYFLKRFQKIYPDKMEIIAFCHYFFGKNYMESETPKYVESRIAFTHALALFTEINHDKGLVIVRDTLLELDRHQTGGQHTI